MGSTVDTITPNRALESFLENGRVVDLLFQEQSGKKERKSTGKLYSDIGRLSAWSACVRTCTFLGGKRGLEMLRSVRQQFRTSRQSLETMRCLLYMLLVGIVLVFLRVNEQDWAERQQHGGERVGSYRSTGQLQNL